MSIHKSKRDNLHPFHVVMEVKEEFLEVDKLVITITIAATHRLISATLVRPLVEAFQLLIFMTETNPVPTTSSLPFAVHSSQSRDNSPQNFCMKPWLGCRKRGELWKKCRTSQTTVIRSSFGCRNTSPKTNKVATTNQKPSSLNVRK